MPVDQSESDETVSGTGRRRRQHVIAVLEDEQTPMTIDELTDQIVEWEADRTPSQSPPDRRQVREELHDVDLPALAEKGLVAFEQSEGLVGRHETTVDTGPPPDAASETMSEPGPTLPVVGRYGHRIGVAVTVATVLVATVVAATIFDPAVVAVTAGSLIAVGAMIGLVFRRRSPTS